MEVNNFYDKNVNEKQRMKIWNIQKNCNPFADLASLAVKKNTGTGVNVKIEVILINNI